MIRYDFVADISRREFRALAEFRFQIRVFLNFSDRAAEDAGLERQQHQLLLIVKAAEPEAASIRHLAGRLLLRHNSAVGLVDRLEHAGYLRRTRSPKDRRTVQVRLTRRGSDMLHRLSLHHRRELRSAIPRLISTLTILLEQQEGSRRTRKGG